MRKILSAFLILVGALSIGLISGKIVSDRQRAQIIKPDILTASSSGRNFVWGATVRPYILTNDNRPYNPNDLDRQFEIIKDLFPNGCVRANIEGDMAINDQLVKNKEKYGLRLYLILEEIKDFDQNINYEKSASDFAQKTVARYKGKVDYYQLSNELSGVVYAEPSEPGEKLDAGYGLVMNKNRYEHVRRYATTLSREIRRLDPNAKIVITGHWVLINPVLELIKDGVQADIIGWNWGTGMGEIPGVKNIDNYAMMDIPKMAKSKGKDFMIIEANSDDGSKGGKEKEQARYIKKLASNAYQSPNVSGYFHFLLTDAQPSQPGPDLGLVRLKKTATKTYGFGSNKIAYDVLKNLAAQNH
ncbi:MAG TPA: hypothetical protein VJB62_03300 [Patescibacteria group bacterium]|nr:hypothetical protein [Patescibacteria group bacterium]